MSNKPKTFKISQYDMIRLNFLHAITDGAADFITLSVFVENAGINGEFDKIRDKLSEGRKNYTYGGIVSVEERSGSGEGVVFRFIKIEGAIRFEFKIKELAEGNESVALYQENDHSYPFHRLILGKGVCRMTLEPVNDKSYFVTITEEMSEIEPQSSAAPNMNNLPEDFPARSEAIMQNPIHIVAPPEEPRIFPALVSIPSSTIKTAQTTPIPATPISDRANAETKLLGISAEKSETMNELTKTKKELFEEISKLNEQVESLATELREKENERRSLERALGELRNRISEQEAGNAKLSESIKNRDKELIELKKMYEYLEAESQKNYPDFAERKAELESRFTVDKEIINRYLEYLEEGGKPSPIESSISIISKELESMEEMIGIFHGKREKTEKTPTADS